jgi:hypothetical protein
VAQYAAAAAHARRLSAHASCVAHLQRALELLRGLPASPERDAQELRLHLALGTTVTAAQGWAPPELEAVFARARDLAERVDDVVQVLPALWQLQLFHLGRAEHDLADRAHARLSARSPNASTIPSCAIRCGSRCSRTSGATSVRRAGSWRPRPRTATSCGSVRWRSVRVGAGRGRAGVPRRVPVAARRTRRGGPERAARPRTGVRGRPPHDPCHRVRPRVLARGLARRPCGHRGAGRRPAAHRARARPGELPPDGDVLQRVRPARRARVRAPRAHGGRHGALPPERHPAGPERASSPSSPARAPRRASRNAAWPR